MEIMKKLPEPLSNYVVYVERIFLVKNSWEINTTYIADALNIDIGVVN